jgi:serine/threonine protein kinase
MYFYAGKDHLLLCEERSRTLACHVSLPQFSRLNLVLKTNHIGGYSDNSSPSSQVSIKGGTICYQAPELFKRNAKFSRRADVFAAGIIFLELLTLQKPNTLWDDLFPGILKVKLPAVLLTCFSNSLDPDPEKRMQFKGLLLLLRSQDGMAIGELELGSPAAKYTFDEVAADIRFMMPSSQYVYESGSTSPFSLGRNRVQE